MDAYDEDPGARPDPGGSARARPEDSPTDVDSPANIASRADRESSAGGGFRAGAAESSAGTDSRAGAAAAGGAGRAASGADAPVPRTGVAALSPRYQVAAALALAVVGVAACVHLLMVFLSLAPANTVTKQHGKAVEDWVFPEFEQNWKLFAPNPLQQNIAVQVRAVVRAKDGGLRTTGWTDLSAQDGAAIDGNLVPSHAQQNELRRSWDFFTATHSADNRPVGMRGSLSEQYLRRIVVMRLYRTYPADRDGVIQRVQIRSSTTNVQPPGWSRERVSDQPVYRVLPWWTVTADEAAGGVR
ncbi:hypothetical protein FB563_2781 [Streptomyces puniciscabiei]|uniref:Uncharacterized protein n=1 Tax=Streptomyces puniciscabiei TaxID=164348 RepID=A0A542UFE3_9ACTN|nr:DUF5819 family protein [Streptomyces puniciscabiei]TQK97794.1 hypothetical protein FB563_2781 [Streptomyces puniciscabiei]